MIVIYFSFSGLVWSALLAERLVHASIFATALHVLVITARKRSCGKVTFLHLSVILFTGGSLSGGSLWGGVSVGGSLSRGSLSGWSLSRGSLYGGVSVRRQPPYGKERTVRILLECILVLVK